jgi:predicted component of type VI protein secretion system
MATSQRFGRSARRLNRIFALRWHNLPQKREADSGKQPSRSLGIAHTLGDRMRQREWSVAIGAGAASTRSFRPERSADNYLFTLLASILIEVSSILVVNAVCTSNGFSMPR